MKILKDGILIALEGVDGSGKTTLARGLERELTRLGREVVITREPGGTDFGKRVRAVVQHGTESRDPKAEFLLFAADRAHHITSLVVPSLKEKKIIISDRMADSSLAYQGYGRNVDIDMIERINRWVMGSIEPDLVLYVKVDLETACNRIEKRGETLTAFEREKRDFFARVIRGFEVIFHGRSNVVALDGSQRPEVVLEHALSSVMKLLAQKSL